MKNDAAESISKEIDSDNITKGQFNRRESNTSLNQNARMTL